METSLRPGLDALNTIVQTSSIGKGLHLYKKRTCLYLCHDLSQEPWGSQERSERPRSRGRCRSWWEMLCHSYQFLSTVTLWPHCAFLLIHWGQLVFTVSLHEVRHFVNNIIKPAVGRIFLASFGKNSTITFQHIVIRVFWEITRLLNLLMALFSGFKKSSPWRETLTNHRSFQRERSYWAFLLAVLQLVGSAWYFFNWSQHGCQVTNFLILQLNSTLQDVSENIWGEK